MRLDSIVYHFLYHLNFFQSFYQLRKFILYKGIIINGKLFKNPNKQIKVGDVVELDERSRNEFMIHFFKVKFCN